MNTMISISILLPILLSLLVYLAMKDKEKLSEMILIVVSIIETVCSLVLLVEPSSELSVNGVFSFGLSFSSGGFHSVMALITALGWLVSSVISKEFFKKESFESNRFYSFSMFVLGAVNGVFYSADLITLFIFFEMMSLASWVWVANPESEQSRVASQTYLYVGIIGGLAMLSGIIILYFFAGTFSFSEIYANTQSIPIKIKLVSALLMLVGFGAKAGMFPLHIWLPGSYTAAPTPGTALLSGVLSKSGVFGIALISCWVLLGNASWGDILLILATLTMLGGALLALFSTDLKRTLACSSMSQIGFILVGCAMASLLGEHNAIAASGLVLHAVNHTLIKLTLFTVCAIVFVNTGKTDFKSIRGYGKGKLLLMLCFLSCACSVAGIPGFSGYISKTLLHEGIVEFSHLSSDPTLYKAVEYVFLLSGGLTFAYMSRLFYVLFISGEKNQSVKAADYTSVPVISVVSVLAVLMPVLGLTAASTMDRIAAYSMGFFNTEAMHPVHYFSFENLKGAAISVSVGILVFLLVGMKFLTVRSAKEEKYLEKWPEWLNIENKVYRPGLKLLALAGAILARTYELMAAFFVYLPINIIFYDAKTEWNPRKNKNFGAYVEQREKSILQSAFSLDLLCACFGISIFLILVIIKLL